MLDCSALVRMLDNGEIYMGHATWRNFAAMLRHYKFYEFHYHSETVRLSFSASPGRNGARCGRRLHQLEGRFLRERVRNRRDGDDQRDLRREAVPVLHDGHRSFVHRSPLREL